MPAGGLFLGGNLQATSITDTGNLTFPAVSTIAFGSGNTIISAANSLTFNQPLYDASTSPSAISLLDSNNIVTPLLQSGSDLNLRTPSNLNIAANQINISTSGNISMGQSYYGTTTASVSTAIYTPTVNTAVIENNGGITINANSGNNSIAILSNNFVMENQQPITFAGSSASYGLSATVPGNLTVGGNINGNIITYHDLNNTAHPSAYVTGGLITLNGSGQYTLNVPGTVVDVQMTPLNPDNLDTVVGNVKSSSGGTVVVQAHFANLNPAPGYQFYVTVYSY